jgi:hypothetical protein
VWGLETRSCVDRRRRLQTLVLREITRRAPLDGLVGGRALCLYRLGLLGLPSDDRDCRGHGITGDLPLGAR